MNKFHQIHLTASDLLGQIDRLGQSDRKRLLESGATNWGPFAKSLRNLFVAAGRLGSAAAKPLKRSSEPDGLPTVESIDAAMAINAIKDEPTEIVDITRGAAGAKNMGTAPENKALDGAPEDKGG